MKQLGDFIDRNDKRYRKKPQFTTIHHVVKDKFDLSLATYAVIDSVHVLSHTDQNYYYCVESKEGIADFLKISRRTVFNALKEALEKGLVEKNPSGHLRTTQKWVDAVLLYAPKVHTKR